MNIEMSLKNLSEALPEDLTPDQKAKAQTLFLKTLHGRALIFRRQNANPAQMRSLGLQLVQCLVYAGCLENFDYHTRQQ